VDIDGEKRTIYWGYAFGSWAIHVAANLAINTIGFMIL